MSNPYDFLNDEIPLPPYTKVEDNLLKGEGWSTKVSKNFQAALATDILNDKFFLRGVAEKALDNKATFLDLTHREKETVIRYFRNMILRYSCKATGTGLFYLFILFCLSILALFLLYFFSSLYFVVKCYFF